MKTRLLDTTALTEFTPRSTCFAEQDADAGGAAGAGGGDAGDDAPELQFEDDADDGAADTGAQDDDDSDELEIGPTKHRVPKAVKEAWNGVQKTTQAEREAIAEEKKSIAAKEQRYQDNMRIAASYLKEISKIQSIDEQIADFDKLTPADWITWAAQDKEKAQQAQIGYNALLSEKRKLLESVQSKENTIKTQQERERSEFIAKSERELATKIKGWSPEKKTALLKVGNDLGFSQDELTQVAHDPRVMGMLDEVRELREAKARAKKTMEDAKAARIAEGGKPEPIKHARGNAGSANSLGDNVSMETFAKNFKKMRAKSR